MTDILKLQENYNSPFLLYTTGTEKNVKISKDPTESINILQSSITQGKKSTKIQSTINIIKYIFEKIYENIFTLPCIILVIVSGYKLMLFKNLEKEGDIEHIKQLQEKGEKMKKIKEKMELLVDLNNSDKDDDIRQRSTLESEIPVLISDIEQNYVDSENKLKDSYKWSTIVIIMGINLLAIFYFLYKIGNIYTDYKKYKKEQKKKEQADVIDFGNPIYEDDDNAKEEKEKKGFKDVGKAAAGGLKSGVGAAAGGLKDAGKAAAGGLKSGVGAAAGGLKDAGKAAAGGLKSLKIKKDKDKDKKEEETIQFSNPIDQQQGGKENEKDDKDDETESGFSWFRLFYIVLYIIMIGIHIYFIYSLRSTKNLIEETIDMVCGEESVIPVDGTTKAFCDSISN